MAYSVDTSPLGQKTNYISSYDASLLFPIPRKESRAVLGIKENLPFNGCDIWTGYELSWLTPKGKPQVAMAEFIVPCDSQFIIESKSFKLYLNSLNQTSFASFADVEACLVKDLSAVAGAPVDVKLQSLQDSTCLVDCIFDAVCLDELDIAIDTYHPNPEFLTLDSTQSISGKSLNGTPVKEKLCSHLLKSNCPVTGQPDWASVFIEYTGQKINHENLLRYIVSFREHQDFHEHCAERMFVDIMNRCKPDSLSIYARYTRRGGLDINPFRTTEKNTMPKVGRLLRQ